MEVAVLDLCLLHCVSCFIKAVDIYKTCSSSSVHLRQALRMSQSCPTLDSIKTLFCTSVTCSPMVPIPAQPWRGMLAQLWLDFYDSHNTFKIITTLCVLTVIFKVKVRQIWTSLRAVKLSRGWRQCDRCSSCVAVCHSELGLQVADICLFCFNTDLNPQLTPPY